MDVLSILSIIILLCLWADYAFLIFDTEVRWDFYFKMFILGIAYGYPIGCIIKLNYR